MNKLESEKFNPIPDLPEQIKIAIENERLAIFLGAGVSRIVGCMGWDEFARSLIEKCYETEENGDSLISFREREALLSYNDNKKIISICKKILDDAGKESIFIEQVTKALTPDCEKKKRNIYEQLSIFVSRALFLTTNADECFDDKYNHNNVKYDNNEFRANNIDKSYFYHIHGSINKPDSMVLTVREYIKRYSNPNYS